MKLFNNNSIRLYRFLFIPILLVFQTCITPFSIKSLEVEYRLAWYYEDNKPCRLSHKNLSGLSNNGSICSYTLQNDGVVGAGSVCGEKFNSSLSA